jgi:tripartite-type tricarboxylate transporter receptor subunit TctC
MIARIVAEKLSEGLGEQFDVENHAGASGNIGTGIALNAAPDGYTILFATRDLAARYHPTKNFVPIALVAASPHVIMVHPSVPVKTMKELVALLHDNPGRYNFASPGTFTSTHLAAERFFKLSNAVDVIHVPFDGAAPAIASTIEGYTLIAFTALPPVTLHLREGRLRALAVTSSKRCSALADVPTLEEAGFPGHESDVMVAIVAPAGTSKEIIGLLRRQILQIAALPNVKREFGDYGFEPVDDNISEEEFATRLEGDTAKWATVVRKEA